MSILGSDRGPWWAALVVSGIVACGGGSGSHSKPDARPAAFRDADIYDAADASIVQQKLPDCPASCDDQNPCTTDSCDPDTHLCRNDPGTDGTTCVSSDLCSLAAACKSGLCVGIRTKDCTLPPDQCHEEGYCVPTTGLCSYPNSVDHKACDDNNLCTTGDQCVSGVCQAAPIQCGAGATCNPKTGQCPGFPTATWGLVLDPSASTTGAIDSSFSDLAVSPTGALYFTAGFANTLDLGAGPLSTTSNPGLSPVSFDYNAIYARLDPSTGRALWAKSVGDKTQQVGSSIAANASDIVLVAGVYSGKIDLGPAASADAGTLSLSNTTSNPKLFFVSADGGTGKTLWGLATDIAGDGTLPTLRTRVALDSSDNNFIVCASPTTLAGGFGVTHAGGKTDVLVAKLDAQNGQIIWAGQYGSATDEFCDAITADGNGKVYITGRLASKSSLDLGNGVVLSGPTGSSQQALYVAQLDGATGTAVWGKTFRSQGSTAGKLNPKAIAADDKVVWIGGSFTYSAIFDQLPPLVSSAGDVDAGTSASNAASAFVAALDTTSVTVLWAKNWGTTAEVNTIALNSSGTLLVGGDYLSGMVFETGALSNAPGSRVPFVAKLMGTTGIALTARGYASSSSSPSAFQVIAVDRTSSASTRDVPFAIGVLGDVSNGIDLGSPVGILPEPGSMVDGGAFSNAGTLFMVKFDP